MHKNKIKKYNSFFIVGLMVGILFSVTGVYAVTQYASNTVYYINKNSGLSSNNVQGAIDELATIHKPGNNDCPSGYVCTKNLDVYTINLDASFGISDSTDLNAGTVKIYLMKDDGIYLDRGYTKKMTTTENPITIPVVTGYTFKGYYNDSNEMLINENGYITSTFTIDKFSKTSTINAKWEANNYVITLNTNKPSPLNDGYYTNGTNTVYMKYGTGVYLDNAYTNKMTTSDNAVTNPTATGYNFLGYYDGDTQMIDANGKITSNFTNSKYASAKTLTAKWKRNFTCDAVGKNISYANATWTVISKNTSTCELVWVNKTSFTGSYNDASSKLTSTYLTENGSNKVLYNEMKAGLLNKVNGNYYADTNVDITKYGKISGLYWYASGKVWDSDERKQYSISSTYNIYSGGYTSSTSSTTYDSGRTKKGQTLSETKLKANRTVTVSNTSANYTLTNGAMKDSVVTGSKDNRFSRYWSRFKPTAKSSSSFKLNKWQRNADNSTETYTNTSWRTRFKTCGGSDKYGNVLAHRFTALSNTKVRYGNIITEANDDNGVNLYLYMAGVATSTTENITEGVRRTYNHYDTSNCLVFKTYTLSNVNYPIHYRLHISVKI